MNWRGKMRKRDAKLSRLIFLILRKAIKFISRWPIYTHLSQVVPEIF